MSNPESHKISLHFTSTTRKFSQTSTKREHNKHQQYRYMKFSPAKMKRMKSLLFKSSLKTLSKMIISHNRTNRALFKEKMKIVIRNYSSHRVLTSLTSLNKYLYSPSVTAYKRMKKIIRWNLFTPLLISN